MRQKIPSTGYFSESEIHFLVTTNSLEVNGYKAVLNSSQKTHLDWDSSNDFLWSLGTGRDQSLRHQDRSQISQILLSLCADRMGFQPE